VGELIPTRVERCGVRLKVVRLQASDRGSVLDVKLAGTTVIPEPVCDVRVLLDLADDDAGTDGVDRSRRNKHRISWLDFMPSQEILDVTRPDGLTK
jgi:hypothetical protein